MKGMRILSARHNDKTGRIEIIKEIVNDDDTVELNGQSIPPEAFEWRAAEYGLDNLDEVIELLVYEPFLPKHELKDKTTEQSRDERREHMNNIKTKLGSGRRLNTKSAKDSLLAFGVDEVHIMAADEDPILVIQRSANFNKEKITQKKEYIESRRAGSPTSILPSGRKSGSHTPSVQVRKLPTIKLSGGKRVKVDDGRNI